jgi:hypothetical protein
MENNDNINNNNNNNNSDDDDSNNNSPIQQRGLLSSAIQYITTPLRRQTRTARQAVLDQQIQIQNLEADLGLDQTILFGEEEEQQEKEEEKQEEEKEEDENENTFETTNMPTTTYTLGGMSVEFDNDEPTQNIDYEVGVVISKSNRPSHGSEGERKLIEGICKTQYGKYNRAETSMKSVERLLQSRSIMDTIGGTKTILEKYDMGEPFTIVFPEDPTLVRHALVMHDNKTGPKTINLLKEFWTVSVEEVALSCSWWNTHGHFKDSEGKVQTFGRDMNWSYLHFKNHVEDILYNEIDKIFQTYEKRERGGPLFFKLLTDILLVSNEQSLASLESTITKYNIAVDAKDDLPEAVKIINAVSITIKAMRGDGKKSPLPDKYVVDIIKVLKTTSVDAFNLKMSEFHSNLDLLRLMDDKNTINTPAMLTKTFNFANKVYKELFNEGIWQECVLQKAKSTFATNAIDRAIMVFWKNRCWNCKKLGCNKTRCTIPIDEARCERNRQDWKKENKGGSSTPAGSSKGTKPFAWRPPETDENNKRVIYGRPHTWNGKASWVEDETPSSGLTETPAGTNLSERTEVPSQVSPPFQTSTNDSKSDDATAITTDTKFSTAEQNEIRRIQANMQNLGASLASMFSNRE